MIELICPFCNKKLEPIGTSGQFQCGTWGCDASFNFIATRDVWEYIDRTHKALDVAVNALNKIANTDIKVIEKEPLYYARAMFSVTNNALGRIQDIEQKDIK